MIIEIKDLPNGQTIDKIDIHIDFQKSSVPVITTTLRPNEQVEVVNFNKTEQSKTPEVPNEMVNAEF